MLLIPTRPYTQFISGVDSFLARRVPPLPVSCPLLLLPLLGFVDADLQLSCGGIQSRSQTSRPTAPHTPSPFPSPPPPFLSRDSSLWWTTTRMPHVRSCFRLRVAVSSPCFQLSSGHHSDSTLRPLGANQWASPSTSSCSFLLQ